MPFAYITFGNPPYTLAEEFVRHSLDHSTYIFYLLRLAFLESQARGNYSKYISLRGFTSVCAAPLSSPQTDIERQTSLPMPCSYEKRTMMIRQPSAG